MRVMICFAKDGSIRYVSHLDLMRAARRLFRRAELPLAYSEGYHPHPILAFAMALPVGASSDREYMDLGLAETMPCREIRERLQAACGPGLSIVGVWPMEENAPSQMAMVTAARWQLTFPRADVGALAAAVERIRTAETVPVEKSNGKHTSTVDIRPGIRELTAEGCTVTALLDAGSKNNIQPMNLADALLSESALGKVLVHRTALLGTREGVTVPLEMCDGVCYE